MHYQPGFSLHLGSRFISLLTSHSSWRRVLVVLPERGFWLMRVACQNQSILHPYEEAFELINRGLQVFCWFTNEPRSNITSCTKDCCRRQHCIPFFVLSHRCTRCKILFILASYQFGCLLSQGVPSLIIPTKNESQQQQEQQCPATVGRRGEWGLEYRWRRCFQTILVSTREPIVTRNQPENNPSEH